MDLNFKNYSDETEKEKEKEKPKPRMAQIFQMPNNSNFKKLVNVKEKQIKKKNN